MPRKSKKASFKEFNVTCERNQLYKKVVGTYDAKNDIVTLADKTHVRITENKPISSCNGFNAPAGNRDQVEVVITKFEKGRAAGYIAKVLSRYVEYDVGIVEYKNGNYYLQPFGTKYGTNLLIAPGGLNGALDGSYVTFIMNGKDNWGKYEVYVKDVFGHKNDANAYVRGVAVKYGLPTDFSPACEKEADEICQEVTKEQIEGRRDLRDVLTIAIDGSDTKDRDDAIRLQMLPNGNYELGVDIADVSAYVKEGSALDADACMRGTSVYAGGQVIPMIPKKLSNGICSLNEKVDRLALSCTMEIDKGGQIKKYKIEESVINCDYNMTYDEVMNIFDGDKKTIEKYSDVYEMLCDMRRLAATLQRRAVKKGYIEFANKEAKLVIDNEGKLEKIVSRKVNEATRLIQSFMIAANITVAKALDTNGYPGIYRIHDLPDEEKIENLLSVLSELGYNSDYADDLNLWKMFQKITGQITGRPDEDYLMELLKRTQKKAKYSNVNTGHFGIAEEYYCHFTSPIRRYPDLDIHRALKAMIRKQEDKISDYEYKFEKDALSSSKAEIKADTVEREIEKIYKCLYMKEHLGEVFEAKISNVVKNGFFVQLDNTIEGFVYLGSPAKYFFDEGKMIISSKADGTKYRLGQKVIVKAVDANEIKQVIDFELISNEGYEE